MRQIAWLVAITMVTPALALPVYCSTWQGITTCTGPGDYVSHETTWNGLKTGDDNQGDRWTRSEWQGREIITVTPQR